jgi:hypothetical protein
MINGGCFFKDDTYYVFGKYYLIRQINTVLVTHAFHFCSKSPNICFLQRYVV